MSSSRGLFVLIVGALVVGALTGCAAPTAGAVDGKPSVLDVDSTPSASPSPVTDDGGTGAATPAAIDLSDPGSWLITFDGVGPLTVGGRISEQRPSMTAFAEDPRDYCPRAAFQPLTGDAPHLWAILDGDFETVTAVVVPGGPELHPEASPKTEAGIGLGATTADLLEAYPDISEPVASNNSLVYAVSGDADKWIDFSTSPEGYVIAITVMDAPKPPSEYCG